MAATSLTSTNRSSWTAAKQGPSRNSYWSASICSANGSVAATVRRAWSAPYRVMLAKSTPGMLLTARGREGAERSFADTLLRGRRAVGCHVCSIRDVEAATDLGRRHRSDGARLWLWAPGRCLATRLTLYATPESADLPGRPRHRRRSLDAGASTRNRSADPLWPYTRPYPTPPNALLWASRCEQRRRRRIEVSDAGNECCMKIGYFLSTEEYAPQDWSTRRSPPSAPASKRSGSATTSTRGTTSRVRVPSCGA